MQPQPWSMRRVADVQQLCASWKRMAWYRTAHDACLPFRSAHAVPSTHRVTSSPVLAEQSAGQWRPQRDKPSSVGKGSTSRLGQAEQQPPQQQHVDGNQAGLGQRRRRGQAGFVPMSEAFLAESKKAMRLERNGKGASTRDVPSQPVVAGGHAPQDHSPGRWGRRDSEAVDAGQARPLHKVQQRSMPKQEAATELVWDDPVQGTAEGGQAALGRRGWDSSRPSTPGVGREAPPARGEWGMPRRGAQQQRALRLTHRERVKLMLESNRRIKLACAAVEEALQESGQEDIKQAALQSFVADLACIVEDGAGHFDSVNVATCLHDLVAVTSSAPPQLSNALTTGAGYGDLVQRLLGLAEREIPSTKMPTVFSVFWSLASAKRPISVSDAFLDGMAARVSARMREAPVPEPKYVTGLIWAYARLRGMRPPTAAQAAMLESIYAVAPSVLGLGTCRFQNIANMVYGIALLSHPPPQQLLNKAAEAALLSMPRADPQGVANIMWAFASLKMSPLDGQLFRAALSHMQPDLDQYNMQNMSNVLWSLGTLQHNPGPAFLDAFAASALPRMQQFTPQHLANCAWSCARLGYNPLQGQFLTAIVQEATRRLDRLDRQNTCNMLWACAALQHPLAAPELEVVAADWARALLRQFEGGSDESRAQHMANAAWSYARLRLNPLGGALLGAVVDAVSRAPGSFTVQNLANVTLAAGIVQHALPAAAVDAVVSEVQARSGVSHRQEITNVLWALAALDQLQAQHFASLAAMLDEETVLENMSQSGARQLSQADMVVRLKAGVEGSLMPHRLQHRVHTLNDREHVILTSRFQDLVSEGLADLGVPHVVEAKVSCPRFGDTTVDILVEAADGARIAVEVDGPLHFTALPPFENLGHTALRNRMLEARGLQVVQVPFHMGMACNGGSRADAQIGFVRQALLEAGVQINAQ